MHWLLALGFNEGSVSLLTEQDKDKARLAFLPLLQ